MKKHLLFLSLLIGGMALNSSCKKEEVHARNFTLAQLTGGWQEMHRGLDENKNGLLDPAEYLNVKDDERYYWFINTDGTGIFKINLQARACQFDVNAKTLNITIADQKESYQIDLLENNRLHVNYTQAQDSGLVRYLIFNKIQ